MRSQPYVRVGCCFAILGSLALSCSMGDTAQKKMFYGAACTICTDTSVWKVLGQKGMDQ
jgi:hypothetical protein